MVGRDAPDSLVSAVRNAIRRVRPEVLAARLKQVFEMDCRDALRACRAPVMYLAARNDALVGPSSANVIRRVRADVRFRTVEGPHLLLQREPEAAWREIALFLEDVKLGRPGRRS